MVAPFARVLAFVLLIMHPISAMALPRPVMGEVLAAEDGIDANGALVRLACGTPSDGADGVFIDAWALSARRPEGETVGAFSPGWYYGLSEACLSFPTSPFESGCRNTGTISNPCFFANSKSRWSCAGTPMTAPEPYVSST